MCFSDIEPGIRRGGIVFYNSLIVAQRLLILLSPQSDLTQVEFDVCHFSRVGDHGFGLEQVLFRLIKALIHVYEHLGQGDVGIKAILNSQ